MSVRYPFHLRPKNKQALQYIRMVVDIVADLELDQDPDGDELPAEQTSAELLEQMRAYLSTYYLVSTWSEAFNKVPALSYTNYTAKCCALLERDSAVKGDQVLVWLVRIQRILEEVSQLRRTNKVSGQNEYQIALMLKGMESQVAEWASGMSPELLSIRKHTPNSYPHPNRPACLLTTVRDVASIRLALLFTKNFVPAAPLLKLPMPKTKRAADASSSPYTPDAARLATVVPDVRAFFDWVLTLPASELNSFSGTEWARFILMVILAFRLSFPVPDCPAWDHAWAREEIGFGTYLERFERMGFEDGGSDGDHAAATAMDVLNAGKVVLAVVRKKWEKRAGRMRVMQQKRKGVDVEGQQQQDRQLGFEAGMPPLDMVGDGMDPMLLDKSMQGCPMMDGSLESYYPLWDESFSSSGLGAMSVDVPGAGEMGGAPPLPASEYVDIWESMTAGWAQWPQAEGA
jgi:hypothetical protein